MGRTYQEHLCADSDERLVELVRGGSSEAFEAIVLRYQEPLLRHCRQMLTPAEAEDAVQEAFLSAFRTLDRMAPDLRLGGWLFRIAHNAALGILRRRTSTLPLDNLPVHSGSADDALLQRLQLRDTLAAVTTLPQPEQRALMQRALAGRGHREIAMSLGRSEGAVRQLLYRARARLRDCLAAVAPLVVRLAPSGGEDRLAGASLAAKGGVILAVGATAVGGGSAVISAWPTHGGPGAPRVAAPSPPAASTASARIASAGTVPALVLASFRRPWSAASSAPEGTGHRGGRTTVPAPSLERGRGRPPSAAAQVRPTWQTTTRVSGQRPAARFLGANGPSNARPTTSASPGQPPAASGQSSAGTTASGAAPGQLTAPVGQPSSGPEATSAAPQRSGAPQCCPAATRGPLGEPTGRSGSAPGRSGSPPGQSGSSPQGQAGTSSHAQSGTSAQAQSGTSSPGRSGSTSKGHTRVSSHTSSVADA